MGYGFPKFISLKNGTLKQIRSFAEQDLYAQNEFWPLDTNKGEPIVTEPVIENIDLSEVDVPELELQAATIIKKNKRK